MKKIIAIFLTLMMLAGFAVIATSCGGDETPGGETPGGNSGEQTGGGNTDAGKDYTVTIVDQSGAPIAGIALKLAYGKNKTEVLTTDSEGKATAKIDTLSNVIVEFEELSKEYSAPAKKARTFAEDATEHTVTLTRLTKYTVTVVDESGAAVSGVSVQICHTVCLLPSDTDSDGKMSVYLDTDAKIKVAIAAAPEGYAVPEAIDEFEGVPVHAYFTDGATEVTVVIPATK